MLEPLECRATLLFLGSFLRFFGFGHWCSWSQGAPCLTEGLLEAFPPGNTPGQPPAEGLNDHEIALDVLIFFKLVEKA